MTTDTAPRKLPATVISLYAGTPEEAAYLYVYGEQVTWASHRASAKEMQTLADRINNAAPDSAQEGAWRCFHCDEVFTGRAAAADHFGAQIYELAGCKLNQQDGGILKMLREAHEELRRYREEDPAMARTFYALGGDHRAALIREEEKGYARGLSDGQALASRPAREGEERSTTILKAIADYPSIRAHIGAELHDGLLGIINGGDSLTEARGAQTPGRQQSQQHVEATAPAIHARTEACGFDRNGSHTAGHYVCACGWEEPDAALPAATGEARHERRVVGHVSGWQEQMDTCVCGARWPCPSAPTASAAEKGTPETDASVRMVVDETPFPIGHLALEAYEAIPAETSRGLEIRLLASEAARKEAETLKQAYYNEASEGWTKFRSAERALTASLDRERAGAEDAERYRWIVANCETTCNEYDEVSLIPMNDSFPWMRPIVKETLDSAIDTARAKAKP